MNPADSGQIAMNGHPIQGSSKEISQIKDSTSFGQKEL